MATFQHSWVTVWWRPVHLSLPWMGSISAKYFQPEETRHLLTNWQATKTSQTTKQWKTKCTMFPQCRNWIYRFSLMLSNTTTKSQWADVSKNLSRVLTASSNNKTSSSSSRIARDSISRYSQTEKSTQILKIWDQSSSDKLNGKWAPFLETTLKSITERVKQRPRWGMELLWVNWQEGAKM